MSQRRDIRRLAMQLLYQIDVRSDDRQAVRDSLDEAPDPPKVRESAYALAVAAWDFRSTADPLITQFATDWPTHRQPPVDRAILRLGCYEIASGRVPEKVAISEAVELAKLFSAEESPAFINGVLDAIARHLAEHVELKSEAATAPPEPPAEDDWLSDALDDE